MKATFVIVCNYSLNCWIRLPSAAWSWANYKRNLPHLRVNYLQFDLQVTTTVAMEQLMKKLSQESHISYLIKHEIHRKNILTSLFLCCFSFFFSCSTTVYSPFCCSTAVIFILNWTISGGQPFSSASCLRDFKTYAIT